MLANKSKECVCASSPESDNTAGAKHLAENLEAGSFLPSLVEALGEAEKARAWESSTSAQAYSLQSVEADLRFGLQLQRQKHKILFWRKKQPWGQDQRLWCRLCASPSPPRKNPSWLWRVSAPGYLLDAAAEQQLAQDVAQALEESRWQGSLPGGATPAQARREAKLIRRSSQDWAQNQGLAGLQLESEEYLFVRLSGQEEAASVFHYRRAAAKPLRILSLEDSTEPSLLSEALAKVIQAIRHSSARVSRSNHLPPLAWGWAGLGHFLEQLRRGCEEALSRLSSLPAPHFAIERLECDLSYSSYRRPKRQSSRDPLLAASEWIHTSVQATAEPPQGVFHLVLRSPEFVLSGETRQWFLRHLLSAAPAIRHTLGGAYLERALCDPEVQQEALILLAGTPKSSPPRFLIAWPHQGKERVLFCRSDGSRLHEVELIQGFEPQRAGPEQQRSLQRALAGWFRALQFWRAQRGGV